MSRILNARAVLICAMMISPALAVSTPGSADLTATINDLGARSGSSHNVVVWVTTSSGAFIKTLWKQGDTSTMSATGGDWDHFTTWNAARNGSTAFDGYSSATASSYTATNPSPPAGTTRASNPIHVVWNCKDAGNVVVADGTYHFYIQYAENITSPSKNGPVTSALIWTKGPSATSVNPADQGTLSSPTGGFNFTNIAITWAPATVAPTITSSAPAAGAQGAAYNHTLTANGSSPISFAVTSGALPTGLTLGSTGVISGTPTTAGLFTGIITASNGTSPNATQSFSINIAQNSYDDWATQAGLSPAQNGPIQTPQNDGVTNLEKFAFNMNPSAPDVRMLTVGAAGTAGLPGGALVGGKLRIEFVRRKAATHPGITYISQFCSGLDLWDDFTGAPVSVTSIDPTWERVVVDDPTAGTGRRFGRVKLVQP